MAGGEDGPRVDEKLPSTGRAPAAEPSEVAAEVPPDTVLADEPPAGGEPPGDDESTPARPPRRRARYDGARRANTRRIAIRRGVVLGLLLVAILTATTFSRETDGGLLHSGKGAVTSITGKVQDVAVAAVRPVRDAWNWFAELRTARSERNALLTEVRRLRSEATGRTVDEQRLAELEQLLRVRDERPSDYRAVTANVIARPLVDVAREARIDKGSNAGITVNSLVFLPMGENVPNDCADDSRTASGPCWYGALAGRVTHVDANTADIVYLTSTTTAIAARTLLGNTQLGLLTANALGDLIVTGVPASAALSPQDAVVTMGVGTDRLMSPYPPGLPIGYVSSFGGGDTGGGLTVQVTPYANLNGLRTVEVYVPTTSLAKRRAGVR